jgi:hypothetical protein
VNTESKVMKATVESLNGMLRTGWELRGTDPDGDSDGLVAVAEVDGETIRCLLEPQGSNWAASIETQDVVLTGGFIITGHVMSPEAAARHIAKAREKAVDL